MQIGHKLKKIILSYDQEKEYVSCPASLCVSVNLKKLKNVNVLALRMRSGTVYTLVLQYTLALVARKTVEK